MIDPKELRLYNIVFSPVGWIGNVCKIGPQIIKLTCPDDGEIYPFGFDLIDPIPITPEWLERLGFEKDEWNNYRTPLDISHPTLLYDSTVEAIAYELYRSANDYLPHIKHIHQLQNLYFALTGKELTIKV